MQQMMKVSDNFYHQRKQMLVQHVAGQGMDPTQTQAFLDHINICEENPVWLGFMN